MYLGGDVVRCPTESGRLRLVPHVFLTHAEVCDLYVTVRVQQDVVELQIPAEDTGSQASCSPLQRCSPGTLPINDSFSVKKLEAADDLGCVEAAGRQSEGR